MLKRLMVSNFLDAAGVQILESSIAMIVVYYFKFSAFDVSLLNFASSIPFIILSVPVGIYVDKLGPLKVLKLSTSLKTLIPAATLLAICKPQSLEIVLIAITFIFGVLVIASETSQVSIIPRITENSEVISSAISKMSAADRVAGVAFPAIAGYLVTSFPRYVAISTSLLLLILSTIFVSNFKNNFDGKIAEVEDKQEGDYEDKTRVLTHGFSIIFKNRFLLAITLLAAAGNSGLAIADVVDAVLVMKHLGLSPGYYGMLSTIAAVSGLIAAAASTTIVKHIPLRLLFGLGSILQAFIALIPLACYFLPQISYPGMIIFSSLWSSVATVTNIASSSYLAVKVDKLSIGRASSARRTITMGVIPIATLSGGLMSTVGGLALPLIVWPTITILSAIIYFILTRSTVET